MLAEQGLDVVTTPGLAVSVALDGNAEATRLLSEARVFLESAKDAGRRRLAREIGQFLEEQRTARERSRQT